MVTYHSIMSYFSLGRSHFSHHICSVVTYHIRDCCLSHITSPIRDIHLWCDISHQRLPPVTSHIRGVHLWHFTSHRDCRQSHLTSHIRDGYMSHLTEIATSHISLLTLEMVTCHISLLTSETFTCHITDIIFYISHQRCHISLLTGPMPLFSSLYM